MFFMSYRRRKHTYQRYLFSGCPGAARHSDIEGRVIVVRGFYQPEPHSEVYNDVGAIEIRMIPEHTQETNDTLITIIIFIP